MGFRMRSCNLHETYGLKVSVDRAESTACLTLRFIVPWFRRVETGEGCGGDLCVLCVLCVLHPEDNKIMEYRRKKGKRSG